jgi:hypothetical protein
MAIKYLVAPGGQDRSNIEVGLVLGGRSLVGHELAVGGQFLHGLALKNAVILQVVEHTVVKDEEAAVDPAVQTGLFVESSHLLLPVYVKYAEGQPGSDDSHRGDSAVGAVELLEPPKVEVG